MMKGAITKSRWFGLALAGACALAGCDLFKPADPELPAGESIAGNYSTIDSSLNTMALAIRAKGLSGGENAYMRALADPALDGRPFIAEFDPATVVRYANTVPNPWRRDEEVLFYGSFAARDPGSTRDMSWSVGDQDDPPATGDSATVYRKYVVTGRGTNNVPYTLAVGQAQMSFIRTSRGWVMVRWIDRQDPAIPDCYGWLRLNNR